MLDHSSRGLRILPLTQGAGNVVIHRNGMCRPRAEYFVSQSYETKKGDLSDVSHLLDQRLHMAQIVFERAATGGSQLVFSFWQSSLEELRARDVACLFEFARVHTEIAVSGVHQVFEIAERQRLVCSERTDDAETQTFMDQAIEIWSRTRLLGGARIRRRRVLFPYIFLLCC